MLELVLHHHGITDGKVHNGVVLEDAALQLACCGWLEVVVVDGQTTEGAVDLECVRKVLGSSVSDLVAAEAGNNGRETL